MKLRSLRSGRSFSRCLPCARRAGCAQLPADTGGASVAPSTLRATATQHWNEYARDLVTRNPSAPSPRVFAYLALAQRNAAVVARQTGRDVDGAVAGASAAVLALFHSERCAGHRRQSCTGRGVARCQRLRAATSLRASKLESVLLQDVIAAAKADRFDAVANRGSADCTGSLDEPGASTRAAVVSTIPGMRPFYLASASEFRAPPPAALGSDAFRATLAEVRKTSDHRTNRTTADRTALGNGHGTVHARLLESNRA
jgi:hypothetical protein